MTNTLGLRGTISADGLIVNDWLMTVSRTDGGARITLTKGGTSESTDVKDGTSTVWAGEYDASKSYKVGDIVRKGDGLYVAVKDSTGANPGVSGKWSLCLTISDMRSALQSALTAFAEKEEAWQAAETARAAAEKARVSAEKARAAAETQRQAMGIILKNGMIQMEVDA